MRLHPTACTTGTLAFLLIVACAPTPYVPADSGAAPPLPTNEYRLATREGDALYRIDSVDSRIFFRVGRDGPMKELGHDHIIASEQLEGIVLLATDPARSRADLRIPLRQLAVDKPTYRSRFGLEPEVSPDSINGTTRNMHDGVLDTDDYPWARASARFASAVDEPPRLAVSITLHGTTFDYLVPVEIDTGNGVLRVNGEMSIEHRDFGLDPFSAAGGLLRVAERISVVFEISGRRIALAELAGMP